MKKCPVCDKTFEDSMRFCQADGTPLVEAIEEAPQDPYKTIVASQDEIASAIPPPPAESFNQPPVDPFKTMVAGSQSRDESGDLLQLPQEFDAMKTAVVSPEEMREQLAADEPKADFPVPSAPPSPLADDDSPLELNINESSSASSSTPSEIPQFSEPSLNPPNFGDVSSGSTEPVPSSNPFSFDSNPVSPEPSAPQESFGGSPFNQPDDAPIPSPFGDAPKAYEQPSTPFQPYKEPEPPTVLGANPFDQPMPIQQEPSNQPFNTPSPQTGWSPPPAPVSNWEDQSIGASTPAQPPQAAAQGQGQNQTMPIISLVFGILSLCCPIAILTGPIALITGFLGMKNVNASPNQYGGKTLAIIGMAIGGLFFLISIVWWILYALGLANMSFNF